MKRLLSSPFALDTRSLALFRIGLGLMLLADLGIRATALAAHYSDRGVLPREVYVERLANPWVWSLHLATGEPAGQAVLFLIAAVAALALAVGYRTRVATLVAWVLLLSLQLRNPFLLNAGDTLLRMLLLWAVFLPTARCWSFDARRRLGDDASGPCGRRVVSVASAALVVQIVLVYAVAGATKIGEPWRTGDALIAGLDQDLHLKPLGAWLLGHPDLLRSMGWLVPWLEVAAAVLLLVPVLVPWVRGVLIVVMLGFHFGIELTLQVGLFSWVMLVAWVALVPTAWWDRLLKRTAAEPGAVLEPKGPFRWAWATTAGLLLVYVVATNLDEYRRRDTGQALMPRAWSDAGAVLGLDQRWMVFSAPDGADGWYIIVIEYADGTRRELLTDQPFDPLTFAKPADVAGTYPHHRWRKYFGAMSKARHEWARRHMAGPLCDLADTQGPDNPPSHIEVNFIEESGSDVRRLVFYRGVCPRETDITFEPFDPDGI